jgi:DNA-binding transcriptional MerR regulator
MSKNQGLTVSQLSKQLNIPASTIRYYVAEYTKFIERKPVQGSKTVLYTGQSIDVLREIRQHQNSGKTKAEILQELEQKYHPTEQVVEALTADTQGGKQQGNNKQQNAIVAQQYAFMQEAAGALQGQVEYQAKIIQQYQEIVRSQADVIEKLSADNTQLKNKRSLLDKMFNK